VIANAGQAAGVLPILNQLGVRNLPASSKAMLHLPAAQPNRERLLVHEASAPRRRARMPAVRATLDPTEGLPTQTTEKAPPSSSCTGLTCHLGYWWRFISLLNGVRIVALDFKVTA
jgi:hypothetical protein